MSPRPCNWRPTALLQYRDMATEYIMNFEQRRMAHAAHSARRIQVAQADPQCKDSLAVGLAAQPPACQPAGQAAAGLGPAADVIKSLTGRVIVLPRNTQLGQRDHDRDRERPRPCVRASACLWIGASAERGYAVYLCLPAARVKSASAQSPSLRLGVLAGGLTSNHSPRLSVTQARGPPVPVADSEPEPVRRR